VTGKTCQNADENMGSPIGIPEVPQCSPVEAAPSIKHQKENAERLGAEFSIVAGGPIYDFLLQSRWVQQRLPNALRRLIALVAITWIPLLLLSIRDGVAFGYKVRVPFLYDLSVYGRFLVALPLLILAEIIIEPGIRMVVAEFVKGGIVPTEERQKFDSVLNNMQRWRDSAVPEIVLLVLAFFPLFVFQREWAPGVVSSWHTNRGGLTAAGWLFAAFSAPMLRFITYRWIFRYLLWSILLWRITRLRLVLMPTHPDHAGGLLFLAVAQRRFGILFCASGAVFAGRMANNLVFEHTPIRSFESLMVGFVVLCLIIGLLPLVLVAPTLRVVRNKGLIDYGKLARDYTGSFDRKWVHTGSVPSEPLLGSSDIQSLADMGNSFQMVEAMNIAPITKRLVLQIGVQAALPLLPVIVLGTPTSQLVRAIIKMVM
jgi:hypothetical protein